MTAVVRAEQLTKRYGRHRGIEGIDLEVEQGEVFGFLAPNGAGKTTTIRLLLDLIRPTSGRALVFGLDSTEGAVEIHRRTGYLPGEFGIYDRLTGGETIAYFASLRGGVDRDYQRALVERLDLDPSRRFREYSKGNKQKVGLVVALQHRPELLVLDEPTAGLDPLVQHEFLALVAEAKAEGRTVFLSSHVIGEVERSCDRVAIVRDGRLVRVDRLGAEGGVLGDLAAHQVEFRFAGPAPSECFASIAGVSDLVAEGPSLRMRIAGSLGPVLAAAAPLDPIDFVSRGPTLEEVFLGEYAKEAGDAR